MTNDDALYWKNRALKAEDRVAELVGKELGPDGKEWAKTAAGYAHVEAVKQDADGWHGLAPWFHGWAVRQAFVAGAEWQEARFAK